MICRRASRDFIESELITEKGFRNSYVREDAVPAHLTDDELDPADSARGCYGSRITTARNGSN